MTVLNLTSDLLCACDCSDEARASLDGLVQLVMCSKHPSVLVPYGRGPTSVLREVLSYMDGADLARFEQGKFDLFNL